VEQRYDAVVVGSGFGGGVTACRLAEAGWSVCVLERGRNFEEFPKPDLAGAPKLLWHRWLNPGGMLDLRSYRDLWVLCAAGVGGGSLAYANVMLRAKGDVFRRGWPQGIGCAELDPYYDRVEEMLQPATTSPDLPKTRALAALAGLAGLPFRLAPIAVYFGEGRTRFGREQKGCDHGALCDVGCPQHAKNSIDLTYLARASAAGADVCPQRQVVDLIPPRRDGEPWKVGFRELESRLHSLRRHWVEAPVVVLAAGSIGSTRLLLKNRWRLRGLSPALGCRFGGNGDALAAAFDPRHPDVNDPNSPQAPVITSLMDLWQSERFIIEDGALPKGLIGLLDLVDTLDNRRDPRSLLLLLKRMLTYLGLSDVSATQRAVAGGRLEAHQNEFHGHRIEDALVFLMMGDEEPNRRMKLTPLRRLDIKQEWESRANDQLFRNMKRKACLLADKAQAADTWLPIGDFGPFGNFITVHPLGGCPMADSPADGVVNSHGAVHGYGNKYGLFVLDGSILPTASGVNPSMTIAALAERGVERLVAAGPPV
jgi:cholesterol oxidase